MLGLLAQVDQTLAARVAQGLGLPVPKKLDGPLNMSVPADGDVKRFQPKPVPRAVGASPALSMANTVKNSIRTRKIAILAADGVDGSALSGIQKALKAAGAQAKIIAPRLGTLKTTQGHDVKIDWSFLTAGSVLFDAVFVPGGDKSLKTLTAEPRAVEFVAEAYKHCKAIGTTGKGMALLQAAGVSTNDREPTRKVRKPSGPEGVVIGKDADMNGVAGKFIHAVAQHRHWGRERQE
jgi:catalase